jgi:hypothetical protein
LEKHWLWKKCTQPATSCVRVEKIREQTDSDSLYKAIIHKKGASSPCLVCEDNPSLNGHLEAMLSTSDETLLNALVIASNPVGSDLLCDAIALVDF